MARPEAAQGNLATPIFAPLLLRLVLGQADPGDFGVGVGDRGDDARVEVRLVAGGGFGRDLALVHRLVREHRVPGDVADGVDVRHVGALCDYRHEINPRASTSTPAFSAPIFLPLGARPTDTRIASYIWAGLPSNDTFKPSFAASTFEVFVPSNDVVEALGVELLPHRDQVAVGAEHQAVHHLHHVQARAEASSRPCPSPGR